MKPPLDAVRSFIDRRCRCLTSSSTIVGGHPVVPSDPVIPGIEFSLCSRRGTGDCSSSIRFAVGLQLHTWFDLLSYSTCLRERQRELNFHSRRSRNRNLPLGSDPQPIHLGKDIHSNFRYNEDLEGVLLAYQVDVRSKVARILSGLVPHYGVKLKATLLVFAPKPDMLIGDAKGSDIVLEAILEAEVARNAKQFFS